MNGLMLMGLATLVFLLAAGGVFAAALGVFRFAGRAVNRNNAAGARALYGALALACFAGIFAAVAAGFIGVTTLMFDAMIQDDL
jgi:hypothetical protein